MSDYKHHQRRKVQVHFDGPGRTKQSHADECDINHMMRKYQKSGVLPPVNKFTANYGDFSNVDDYQNSLNQVLDAKAAFGELPSDIRTRFENDPAKLLVFMADPENTEEAELLGLSAKSVPTDKPDTPEPTPPPTTEEPATT